MNPEPAGDQSEEDNPWPLNRVLRLGVAVVLGLCAIVAVAISYTSTALQRCETTHVEAVVDTISEGSSTSIRTTDQNGDGLSKTEVCKPMAALDLLPVAFVVGLLLLPDASKVAFGNILTLEFNKVRAAVDEAKETTEQTRNQLEAVRNEVDAAFTSIAAMHSEIHSTIQNSLSLTSDVTTNQAQLASSSATVEALDLAALVRELKSWEGPVGQLSTSVDNADVRLEDFFDDMLRLDYILGGLPDPIDSYLPDMSEWLVDKAGISMRPRLKFLFFDLTDTLTHVAIRARFPEDIDLIEQRDDDSVRNARLSFLDRFQQPLSQLVTAHFTLAYGFWTDDVDREVLYRLARRTPLGAGARTLAS